MKFFIFVGILSILGIKSSFANTESLPEALSSPLSEQVQTVRKPLPSTPNDRIARACLSRAAELQEDYLKANGVYATTLEDLKWPDEECFKNFSFTITADQKNYLIQAKNRKVTWQVNHENIMTKL